MIFKIGFKNAPWERGSLIVEATLIVTLLAVLIFGVIEFGRYLAISSALNGATNRAVSLASVVPGLDSEEVVNGQTRTGPCH